jgi:PH domain/leucine-rich repeat-containing protein phosphatase
MKVEENGPRIDYSNPPLKKLNLRANHLKGNIILGNFTVSLKVASTHMKTHSTFHFQYLTQLDMSENSIEFLDLSALDKIESVQCCKNQIKELTLNGRVLNSLVASNNSELSNESLRTEKRVQMSTFQTCVV